MAVLYLQRTFIETNSKVFWFPFWEARNFKKSTFQSHTEQIVQEYCQTCRFANYFTYTAFLCKIPL